MSNRLQQAYDRARHWLREDLPEAETAAAESLSALMDKAKAYLVAAEELSAEEAHRVVEALRLDLREWGHDLQHSGQELADWARIDIDRLESSIAERLLSAADPTWVQLERFQRSRDDLSQG